MAVDNSSELWAKRFTGIMGCVSCGKTDASRIFTNQRVQVDPSTKTISQLEHMVPYLEVWCDTCEPRTLFKARTKGRLARKAEAAQVASLEKGKWYDPSSINQVLTENVVVDKKTFLKTAKDFPCTICEKQYPYYSMEFYHLDSKAKFQSLTVFASSNYTIEVMIEEMEKCALVCVLCQRDLMYGGLKASPSLWKYENYKENILKKLNV